MIFPSIFASYVGAPTLREAPPGFLACGGKYPHFPYLSEAFYIASWSLCSAVKPETSPKHYN